MNEEYQEIDLGKLIKEVLSKWWLIVLLMVIAGGAAYYYTSNYVTPIYRAKSTLFIGKETDMIAGIDLQDLTVDNQLITDYEELIRTRLVTQEVIDEMELVATTSQLSAGLGITSLDESRFMHIYYTDYIPERAADITNTLSRVLADKAYEVIGVQNVRVVDEALVPTRPISPSMTRNVGIAAVLGAMVALGIIFLFMMMDNKIHDEDDIEAILNSPILGMIPEFKGEERRA